MPLSLPNLDDRTFEDLVAQMRAFIPQYTKKWTNHNPSDPGVTILELLAWLTEMVLFRLDKIPERSYLTFLELIGLKPARAQAEITFEIKLSKDALLDKFIIPRGTRVAAIEELTGEEILFETLTPIFKEDGIWEDEKKEDEKKPSAIGIFKTNAINTIVIENEVLGKSDGSPNQVFSLAQRPIFLDKGYEGNPLNPQIVLIDEELLGKSDGSPNQVFSLAQRPGFQDKEGELSEGNLKISESGQKWNYRKDLLEAPRPDPQKPSYSQVYTVEQLPGFVRFGDNVHGMIPPKNKMILCTYRKLGGVRGNVDSGKIIHLKDHIEGLDNSKVKVTNEYPASGGVDKENLKDFLIRGLKRIQERYRAISDEDFEDLAKQAAPGKIARIKVVPDQNLEETTSAGEGHVSLIVLPSCDYIELLGEPQERFPKLKKKIIDSKDSRDSMYPRVKKLHQDILRYLEPRRLITTVVHVVDPRFTIVDLEIRVKEKPGVNLNALIEKIKKKVICFLDPYEGGENGCGWPFGRHVYRSELYQQIEGLEGVDYIEEMLMNYDLRTSFISVGENNLVCLNKLKVNDKELLTGGDIEQA